MGSDVARSDRLVLREMTDGDLDDIAGLLGDAQVMRHYPRPKTRDEAQRWIDNARASYRDNGFGLWTVTLGATGEFLGDCGLTIQHLDDGTDEFEVGYHLLPRFQGQGYATEAAALCRDLARDRFGIRRLTALIAPGNEPSAAVAGRIGMALEKSSRAYGRECLVYAMTL